MNSNYINSAFSGTNSYKDSNSNLKYNDCGFDLYIQEVILKLMKEPYV